MQSKDAPITARAIYRSYAKSARNHIWIVAGVFCGILMTQAAGIVIPIYLSRFFNNLVAISTNTPGVSETTLYSILSTIAALYLLQWTGRRVFGFSIMTFEIRVMRDLYVSSFAYLIRHSHHFFAAQFSGTLTRRVSKYVVAFESLFDSIAMTFAPTVLYLVGAIVVLYLHNATLGIILAAWSLAFFVFQVMVSLWRQPLRIARSQADSALVGGVADPNPGTASVLKFCGCL